MEVFYKIVLSIAIILLILILTFFGVLIKYENQNTIYPPTLSTCPDYWTHDGSGNCAMPTVLSSDLSSPLNTGGQSTLGTSSVAPYSKDGKTFSITNTLWTSGGKSTLCAQKSWANQSNIIWDGVSNYNKC